MRINQAGAVKAEGDALGPDLLKLPLFHGGLVESLRGSQLIIGELTGDDDHCGIIAITMGPDCPGSFIGVDAAELRVMAAEMCRTADRLDQGKGKH